MAKSAAETNDFDPQLVQDILSKIDGYHADLASERGSSMARCRNIRESISNVYKEAKARHPDERTSVVGQDQDQRGDEP
ncbi:hypothetical protein GA0061099_103022 [Bradyrhizobium yuanmingense]|uniref:Uncharacterized protein n=1 Tax=Bradyrhizobium yuanmingense TaxID=108015 RepID=A0A1C3XJ41_9BRAD|nr:hypothetical protein [Bradyrhizobium yuanmingense]TWI17773.1 hypothetical protein IQ15_07363 [Bradyrhizobium yuanmingense]SCB52283.1 hypothetical protein GA0061099_103022 [Bradyrhizobium yuanmingense]